MHSRVLGLVTLLSGLLVAAVLSPRLNAQSTSSSVQSEAQDVSTTTDPSQPTAQNEDKDSGPEKRKWRLRLGGISVGAGYSHFSGPIYPPYAYPYAYAPFGFYPGEWVAASYWYPVGSLYPYSGPGSFAYGDGRGEVRLIADPKAAEVYINGGYAGTADKLKTLWLDPGAYDLTVSAAGRQPFHQRLYVLSGKSLKITTKLSAEAAKETP
jgi:PEGA domain